jgi:hypothetical protein
MRDSGPEERAAEFDRLGRMGTLPPSTEAGPVPSAFAWAAIEVRRKKVDQFRSLGVLPETPLFFEIDGRTIWMNCWRRTMTSPLPDWAPPNRNAMRRRRSSVRWRSHAQSSVVHADLAGLTSSASATRSLRGRLKLHDLVLVARISSLIFLDD